MKNLLFDKPSELLHGRLLASVNFVDENDMKDKEVLDIGCGYGWCELNFLKRGVKRMSAIEISEYDLSTIRQNVKDERLTLKSGSAINLPFSNGAFDTVVSWEVVEHIPKNKEMAMFKEVYRVLKPGGHFYLSTPNKSFFANIFDPAWWLMGHRHYSKEQLVCFAKNNSFAVLDMKIKGRWWNLLGILNMYVAKWIFRRLPFFNQFFLKKEGVEYEKDNGFMNIFVKYKKI